MDERTLGMLIVGLGVTTVVIGLLIASGSLSWFGRLPGDLRFGTANTRVYVPLTSMLLVSVLLSVVASLIRRL